MNAAELLRQHAQRMASLVRSTAKPKWRKTATTRRVTVRSHTAAIRDARY